MRIDSFANRLNIAMKDNDINQNELADKTRKHNMPISQSLINKYLKGKALARQDKLTILAEVLNTNETWLMGYDVTNVDKNTMLNNIKFDNGKITPIQKNVVKIPILGYIKAGIPIEAQEDIVDYINIPIEWTNGGKTFFALYISGDSMIPKYEEKDIVVFLQNPTVENAIGKDCAVMVNCTECTFKKFFKTDTGVMLQAYNSNYPPMFFTRKEVENLPITICGVAVQRISKISDIV